MAEDTKPNYQASCVQLCRAGYRRVWSAEGTRRVSETEETERLRKTPSWSPSEENSTSCVCASHCSPSPSARRVTKTSCELLLQTPRPNNEKGRRVWYGTGRGREGDKGVTHTHALCKQKHRYRCTWGHTHAQTGHVHMRSERRWLHERGKDRDHNKTDIKPGLTTWEFPPVSKCHTPPNLTECRRRWCFLNLKDSPPLHWVIMRNVPSACTVGLPPPLLSSLALSNTWTQQSGPKPLTYCSSTRGNGCGDCLSLALVLRRLHAKQTGRNSLQSGCPDHRRVCVCVHI